ncbi:hypothetical protein [Mesorhizobium sp. P5_C1]
MVAAARRIAKRALGNGYKPPLARFKYGVDFVNGRARGGFQVYGNNNDDGRLFRDPTNTSACFAPAASGLLVPVGASGLRRTTRGHWAYPTTTILNLQARDMTNAAWVRSGAGADITVTRTGIIGADGAANTGNRLTCVNAGGTILQTVVLASSQPLYQLYIKRVSGTGPILATVDNVTFEDITAEIGAGGVYLLAFTTKAGVTSPVFGLKMANPGDVIDADFNQMFNPPNGVNVPNPCVAATVAATIFLSQSRPSANNADAAPKSLITAEQGNFAFYWQGRSMRPTGGFIITGATGVFCSVQADGSVKFSANAGGASSAAGKWKFDNGLTQVNKVAGYFKADGTIKVACNGSVGSGTGATTTPTLDHADEGTNGAGPNSIYGLDEEYLVGPNLTFSDAELFAMTA